MTHKQALKILINNAAENVAGTGVGIRSAITDAQRADVVQAIRKVYPKAYGVEATYEVFFNLRIPVSEPPHAE